MRRIIAIVAALQIPSVALAAGGDTTDYWNLLFWIVRVLISDAGGYWW